MHPNQREAPAAGQASRSRGELPWRQAMHAALYGPDGFYRQPGGPAHFSTSVSVSTSEHGHGVYPAALLTLLHTVDAALGYPDDLALLDVGAGNGALACAILRSAPAGLATRLHPVAVEVTPPAPCGPPAGAELEAGRLHWRQQLPEQPVDGLLLANEYLDNIALHVAETDAAGTARYVLVEPETGRERLGEELHPADADWLARWWPLGDTPGLRAEIGRPRDEAWAEAVRAVRRGTVLAVDYAHDATDRPLRPTLTGYRDGRAVPPLPDGTRDLTAHVALDSCAAAGEAAGAWGTVHTTQREALRRLGVSGARPALSRASDDPAGYLRALAAAGEAAELTDPLGLGGFGWLRQRVGPAESDTEQGAE